MGARELEQPWNIVKFPPLSLSVPTPACPSPHLLQRIHSPLMIQRQLHGPVMVCSR